MQTATTASRLITLCDAAFSPPSSPQDIIQFLNDSGDHYVTLARASPRKQVNARTYRNEAGLLPIPMLEAPTIRQASLPTKFQRTNSSSTVASAASSSLSPGGEDEDTITPVSAVFAKFAVNVADPAL